MNKTKISVIIPCYNQGDFIDETLLSVLNQTYQNFEIIIINDGSTDTATNTKLREINHPKIAIYRINNSGSACARNYGFTKSNGEYVQFLDSDDLMDPDKLEKQVAILEQTPEIDVCYCDFDYCDIKGNKINKDFSFQCDLGENPLKSLLYQWERGLTIAIHSFLFRRSVWNSRLPFDETLRSKEDWVSWCNLAINKKVFHKSIDTKVYYRTHNNNKTNNIELTSYNFYKATALISSLLDNKERDRFVSASFDHLKRTLHETSYYKKHYETIFNSYDYKIGRIVLMPFRKLKKILSHK